MRCFLVKTVVCGHTPYQSAALTASHQGEAYKKIPSFEFLRKTGNKFARGTTFVGAEKLRPLKFRITAAPSGFTFA